MAGIADTYTVPNSRWVTQGSADVWSIDLTNQLTEGETITASEANLVYAPNRIDVEGFVIGVTHEAASVLIAWDASVLMPDTRYYLHTIATLSSANVIDLITEIICAG